MVAGKRYREDPVLILAERAGYGYVELDGLEYMVQYHRLNP
jgi:hypothetical protein